MIIGKTQTMRGKSIDMARLIAQNSHKVALGNANMNARGDIVNTKGVVTVPREHVAREYHRNNPKAVKQIALKDIKREVVAFDTPAQAVQAMIKHRDQQREQPSEETQPDQQAATKPAKSRKIADNS